jgi:hypothetical protein
MAFEPKKKKDCGLSMSRLISKLNFLSKKASKQLSLMSKESLRPSYLQIAYDEH